MTDENVCPKCNGKGEIYDPATAGACESPWTVCPECRGKPPVQLVAESRLAKIVLDSLMKQMPEDSKWHAWASKNRAPWMLSPVIEAASAALPLLLNDLDLAEVLTRKPKDLKVP